MKTPPISTVHLFPLLDAKLIELLKSLSEAEWHKQTRAKLWSVKDVAAHLLDGNIRTLAMARDGYVSERPEIHSYRDLVNYLNELNADWVKAMRRVSPAVLIDMLEHTGQQYAVYLKTLDPYAPAIFSVGWAGEKESLNWFHIAREFTEKWHHQQQIREAVDRSGITNREFYHPVLDTFMQALPHTFRDTPAPDETTIHVTIIGDSGGDWYITMKNGKWHLTALEGVIKASISIDQNEAWKLLTKGLSEEQSKILVKMKGDTELVKPFLSMIAVMA